MASFDFRTRTGRLTLRDYGRFCHTVANAYDNLPEKQEDQTWRWKRLAEHVDRFYRQMQSRVKVKFVPGQPYDNAREMVDRVRKTGVLEISKDGNRHPYFTPEQNLRFRAVHDYIVHIMNADKGIDFSQRGEMKAFNLHRRLAPKDTWPALFTEVAAQACYANARGTFPDQKLAVLPQFSVVDVGNYADGTPVDPAQAKHPGQQTKSRGISDADRKVLWNLFLEEDVPNPLRWKGEGEPQRIQRKVMLDRDTDSRNALMREWKRYLRSKVAQ